MQIGLDVFSERDSARQEWAWLNILCQGTTFQVTALLNDTISNPSSTVVLEAGPDTQREAWPLTGPSTSSGRAAPWQIGQLERRGEIWKEAFRKLSCVQQVRGGHESSWPPALLPRQRIRTPVEEVSLRRNGCYRKQIRLPAALCEEDEANRLGAQALGAKMFRKTQLRMAAWEALAQASNSDALRRAELRKIRPSPNCILCVLL